MIEAAGRRTAGGGVESVSQQAAQTASTSECCPGPPKPRQSLPVIWTASSPIQHILISHIMTAAHGRLRAVGTNCRGPGAGGSRCRGCCLPVHLYALTALSLPPALLLTRRWESVTTSRKTIGTRQKMMSRTGLDGPPSGSAASVASVVLRSRWRAAAAAALPLTASPPSIRAARAAQSPCAGLGQVRVQSKERSRLRRPPNREEDRQRSSSVWMRMMVLRARKSEGRRWELVLPSLASPLWRRRPFPALHCKLQRSMLTAPLRYRGAASNRIRQTSSW